LQFCYGIGDHEGEANLAQVKVARLLGWCNICDILVTIHRRQRHAFFWDQFVSAVAKVSWARPGLSSRRDRSMRATRNDHAARIDNAVASGAAFLLNIREARFGLRGCLRPAANDNLF
jgi:hypothetical protein